MKHYVGLDISMKTVAFCIVDEQGKIVKEGMVPAEPTAIADVLKDYPCERVGLETGSLSRWLTHQLRKLGLPVICLNTKQLAALIKINPNKTDRNDAREIAKAVRHEFYKEVHVKSDRAANLSTLLSVRRIHVRQRVEIKNTIRGLLKTHGIRLQTTAISGFSDLVRERLIGLDPLFQTAISALVESYERLSDQVKRLDVQLRQMSRETPETKRLMTVPGVGPVTALQFISEIDDPKRFDNSRVVGAYMGMTPSQYSSGESVRMGRISRCGSTEMRNLLYEAGLVLLTRTHTWSRLKAWGVKIAKKRGMRVAATAVGRKLAVVMHRMLVTEKDFIYGEAA